MADRGRDLKVSILSDAERFDLAHPVDELDKVADAAKDTGTALGKMDTAVKDSGTVLETLGKDTKAAGGDLDALAKDAKTTAAKVDSSFDAIAKASKQKLAKGMDDGASSAKGSLNEIGSEASGTAAEVAASFDGSASSVADGFQELAANALGSLGVIGMGVGIAAAAGIGMIRAQAEKTKAAIGELVTTLIDQGGKLNQSNVLDKLKEFAADGTLVDLKRQAQEAKIPVNDFLLAVAGDPAAIARTTAAVDAAKVAMGEFQATDDSGDQNPMVTKLRRISDALFPVVENYEAAATAAGVYEGATVKLGNADEVAAEKKVAADKRREDAAADAAEAQALYSGALEGFTDPLDVYETLLEDKVDAEKAAAVEQAKATKDSKDDWSDYAGAVSVSIGEYLATLEKQIVDQEFWAANMKRLAGRVSEETLAELAEMGPKGATLVAELAAASGPELDKFNALAKRKAAAAGDAFAAGLKAKEETVAAAAARVRDIAAAQLKLPLVIDLALNDKAFRTSLNEAVGALSAYPLLDPSRGRVIP